MYIITVRLYTGTPGSGKSLHLADRLRRRVRAGRPTIANFPISIENIMGRKPYNGCFTFVDNDSLTPQFLKEYASNYWSENGGGVRENSILLVIDEAQLMFNPREWNRKDRSGWLAFFTLHRHLGYEIVLCTQNEKSIDRQIRDGVIEYQVIHRRLKNFGWRGALLNLAMGGMFSEVFVAVERWYPIKERIGSEFFRANKKLFKVYDTFLLFEDGNNSSNPPIPQEGEERCSGAPSEDLVDSFEFIQSFIEKKEDIDDIKEDDKNECKKCPEN